MKHQCEEQQFLKDISSHEMTIIRNDDVDRHIRFSRPGSSCYRFDLITWSGHLCITGDCGTYVFQRIHDMFEFFRMDKHDFNHRPDRLLNINPSYCGEKLLSIGTNAGYKEFDDELFKKEVREYFDEWKDSCSKPSHEIAELWEEIESQVLNCVCDGEHEAYRAVYYFEHDGFQFQDFFDGGGTERYTFHYLWCLYAIVWGIQQFDAAEKENSKSADQLIAAFDNLLNVKPHLIFEIGYTRVTDWMVHLYDKSGGVENKLFVMQSTDHGVAFHNAAVEIEKIMAEKD